MALRPLMKTHGGKNFLKNWIIAEFPNDYVRMTYIEPFLGGGSILLNKQPSVVEIVNDADLATITVWRMVRVAPQKFIDSLNDIAYSEANFNYYKRVNPISPLHFALKEYVLRRMSRGGLKKSFSKSNRLRGGKMGDENAWLTAIEEIPKISKRIWGVSFLHEDAVRTVKDNSHDPNTLIYLDPPYLHSTRKSKRAYTHEMSDQDHERLLRATLECRGKVIISGYDSTLYRDILKSWNMKTHSIVNHSSQKSFKSRKTECLWKNF